MLILVLKCIAIFLIGNIFGILSSMLIDTISERIVNVQFKAYKNRLALKVKTKELIMKDRALV